MPKLILSHGGVDMPEDEATFDVLRKACERAWGETDAVDSIVAGLGVLEDDPAFNAGYGSVLTSAGTVEVDAAIVDARSGRHGAVGAVPGVRHPIAVAGAVLRSGGPVLLSGHGAGDFARSIGHDSSDLKTAEQVAAWRATLSGMSASPFTGRPAPPSTETIGCIVIDGATATAGSSTGGVSGKLPGRIGDSAILGAGLWADEGSAVLCSGAGEAMISLSLARRVGERITSGANVHDTVRWAVRTAADECGAVSAVLAVETRSLSIAAAHSGASFPVVAQRGDARWVVEVERLAPPA